MDQSSDQDPIDDHVTPVWTAALELKSDRYRKTPPGLIRRVFASLFGSVALVAYAIPAALGMIVLWAVYLLSAPKGSLVLSNDALVQVGGGSSVIITAIVNTVVIFLVALFALSSASIVIVERMRGESVTLRQAWRAAGRSYARTLLHVLPLVAIGLIILAIGAAVAVFSVWWLGLGVAAVIGVVLAPLLLVFPIVAATGRTGFGSLVFAWCLHQSMVKVRVLRVTLTTWVIITVGAFVGLLLLSSLFRASLLEVSAGQFVLVVVGLLFPLVILGICCDYVVDGLGRLEASEAPTVSAKLPALTRRAVWPVWLVASAVPVLLLAAVFTLNPTGLTVTDVASAKVTLPPISAIPLDDGRVATVDVPLYKGSAYALCSARACDADAETSDQLPRAVATGANGTILTAQWYLTDSGGKYDGAELRVTTTSAAEVAAMSALTVKQNEDAGPLQDASVDLKGSRSVLESIRNPDLNNPQSYWAKQIQLESYLAIDTSGRFPVIATVTTPGSSYARDRISVLAIYRCQDARCSTATTQKLDLAGEPISNFGYLLDVATAPDGTAWVTIVGNDGLLLYTAKPGTPITSRTLSPDHGSSAFYDDTSHGAAVVVTPSGFPTVLSRVGRKAPLTLITCQDTTCSKSSSQVIAGTAGLHLAPALAVDSSGRPMVAVYKKNAVAITLLSCHTAACSAIDSRAILPVPAGTNTLSLAIDRSNHPLLTATTEVETGITRPSTLIIRCAQARCGAP